jgi:hypothetical protein
MNTTPSDALVREADVRQIAKDIADKKWFDAVCDILMREPELVLVFVDEMEAVTSRLEQFVPDAAQRERLRRQILRAIWVPMVLLDRAHRKQWDELLPADGDEQS